MIGSNREAFERLVESLTAAGSLTPNVAVVELGHTLAGDMDRGTVIVCECGEVHPAGRSASLVKQYRDVLEAVGDPSGDADDPIDALLAEIRNAATT